MRSEAAYQAKLVDEIKDRLPGCMVIKNNPKELQGVPDLLVLYGTQWAMLEVKLSANSPIQPNQPYYIETLNHMSFAAFIYPENEEQVLDDLQTTLRALG